MYFPYVSGKWGIRLCMYGAQMFGDSSPEFLGCFPNINLWTRTCGPIDNSFAFAIDKLSNIIGFVVNWIDKEFPLWYHGAKRAASTGEKNSDSGFEPIRSTGTLHMGLTMD